MVNSRLKWKCRLGHGLLFAAATGWAWSGATTAQPAPAGGPQGQGMAAKAAARKAAAPPKPAESSTSKQSTTPPKWGPVEAGRRDPFSVPKEDKGEAEALGETAGTGPLPAGKRGLVITELRLEGTLRQSANNSMIAVVTNQTNRAYFLRENDEVYNGVVSKITPDSVYFTENVRDASGQTSSRQVIKRLGAGPGENR